jgi:hypothetical protein
MNALFNYTAFSNDYEKERFGLNEKQKEVVRQKVEHFVYHRFEDTSRRVLMIYKISNFLLVILLFVFQLIQIVSFRNHLDLIEEY